MNYPFSYFNFITHLALLFLWCRIWTDDDRNYFFNPFVTGPMRVVDRVLGVLRIPFPFLPNRVLAAIALITALAVKGVVTHYIFFSQTAPFSFFKISRMEIWYFLVSALLIAGLNALLRLISPRRMDRAGQVADLFARPIGWIRPVALQLPTVFIVIFIFVVFDHLRFRSSFIDQQFAPMPIDYGALFFSTLFSKSALLFAIVYFLGILHVWSQLTLLAILASWLGLIMPRSPIAVYGREFCSLLLGRFSGLLVVGMMDLTPLIFFLVIGWLHDALAKLVGHLLMGYPFP